MSEGKPQVLVAIELAACDSLGLRNNLADQLPKLVVDERQELLEAELSKLLGGRKVDLLPNGP